MSVNFRASLKNIVCPNAFKIISLALIFVVAAVVAQAASGDLDTTFGGTGKIRRGFGGGDDKASATATQADGKLIVAGTSINSNRAVFAVARYNADGSPDTTFDADGRTFADFGSGEAFATSTAIQTDGKIVVAGWQSTTNGNTSVAYFGVMRFNADGSLDATFGTGGKVVTQVSAYVSKATAVAVQTDGKILAGGWSIANISFYADFAVVRYNADGSLDNSFGSGGIALTDFGSSNTDFITAIAIQPDGKILAAGSTVVSSAYQFALARYNANGALDAAFGAGGKVKTAFGAQDDQAAAVAYQDSQQVGQERIIVAGYSNNGSNKDFALARYNTNGSLDTTFGTSGKTTTAFGAGDDAAASLKITYGVTGNASAYFLAGYSLNASGDYDFAVAKYTAAGALNTAFGMNGKVTTAIGARDDVGSAATFQSGNLVVAGHSDVLFSVADFALVRYNLTSGALDAAFDGDGKKTDDVDVGDSIIAKGTAIQPDGKIVVAGYGYALRNIFGVNIYLPSSVALMRLNADGTLDSSFNNSNGNLSGSMIGNAVALASDGKIVVGGGNVGGDKFTFARFNADGTLDVSQTTTIGTSSNCAGNAVAVQSNGKILVAGFAVIGGVYNFALVRYAASGVVDTTFGSSGVVTTSFTAGSAIANSIAIQTDGKIVLAGSAGNNFAAARYDSDGILDAAFGTNGKVTTPVGAGNSFGNAATIQTNGKIVVAGYAANGSNNDFAVVRYNANGSLDSTFGTGGKVTTAIGAGDDVGNAVTIQADGKILVAGSTANAVNTDFAIVRYNADGSLDSSSFAASKADSFLTLDNPLYGSGGKVVADVSGANDTAYGIALDSAGRAVVVGDANNLFGVIRLQNSAPTAASVSISGRVLTPSGKGLSSATVLLTDAQGNTRATRTSTFGYYRFEDVAVGQTYIFEIRSKRFQFAPQVVSVTEDLTDLNFTAEF